MPKIRPVSDLRNYNEVLREIEVDEPVFLTKNGRGRYAIVDIGEYENTSEIVTAIKEIVNNMTESDPCFDKIKNLLLNR